MSINQVRLATLCLFFLMPTQACGTRSGADGAPVLDKDVIDVAPVLSFGEAVRGYVGGAQMNVYKIALQSGDQVSIQLTSEGALNPYLTLYRGGETYVRYSRWTNRAPVFEKSWTVDASDDYLLTVEAFRDSSGFYSLAPECVGGPCSGSDTDRTITLEEADWCLFSARECSFDSLGEAAIALDLTGASEVFFGCLAEVSYDAHPCTGVCEATFPGSAQPAAYCEQVTSDLSLFSTLPSSCQQQVDGCMEDCVEGGGTYGSSKGGFLDAGEPRCWMWGTTSDCTSYAEQLEECGGSIEPEAVALRCYERCEATVGAWTKDRYDACDQQCESACFDLRGECESACGAEPTCVALCLEAQSCPSS